MYALNEADNRGKDVDKEPDLSGLAELKSRVGKQLAQGNALTLRELAIGGRELMVELSLKPSPKMGEVLDRLLEEVLEDPSRNTREQLLDRARALISTVSA
jgi:poly(A) polymerase/tRNA nucleotidyltransferase (CCA-adding enzyme)